MKRLALPLVAGALCCIAASCSYTFDDTAPDVTLLGEPPSVTSFPRLNKAPASSPSIVYGSDKVYWTAFCEGAGRQRNSEGLLNGVCSHMRLVRLAKGGAVREQELSADSIELRFRNFYLFRTPQPDPKVGQLLDIVSAGQTTPPTEFLLPPGHGLIVIGGQDEVFLYAIADPATTTFTIYHVATMQQRTLPLPDMVDPASPGQASYQFTSDGGKLVIRDGKGVVWVHSTIDVDDLSLGKRPDFSYLLDDQTLLTLGDDGLRLIPIAGGSDVILEPEPCDTSKLWFGVGFVYYVVGDELRRTLLDGTGKPQFVRKGVRRLLDVLEDGTIAYSYDEYGRYIDGAGDGWIGDWRFMDRGVWAIYSRDNKRMRWLEHAANDGAIGDLMSATAPTTPGGQGGAPLRLGRNVRQYDELRDGRLLAVENHAYAGTQNRIVTIDEKTRTARWVAAQAHEYQFVPGANELLVDIISGASGFDIVRVPIPPKQ